MCQKSGLKSPLAIKLAKVTVLILFFCFAECAAGSCLSYGHACWGAHGKRAGNPINKAPQPPNWFLNRLLQNYAVSDDIASDPNSEAINSESESHSRGLAGLDPSETFLNDVYGLNQPQRIQDLGKFRDGLRFLKKRSV